VLPGRLFAHYEVIARLGEGGMGTVYVARDLRLERKVALKVLAAREDVSFEDKETFKQRLRREAQHAAQLNSPNIVAVFDVGEVDDEVYVAFEYVEGRTLRSLLHDPDFVAEQRLSTVIDVARALTYAHDQKVIHRDIKPENVMVRPDGLVKVLDFGIARRARSEDDHPPEPRPRGEHIGAFATPYTPGTSPTEDGQRVAGTPNYMAPEQIQGRPPSGAGDQFSWGVLAWELLAGARPFRDARDLVDALQITKDPPVGLRLEPPFLSDDPADDEARVGAMEPVLVRALCCDPGRRFASMHEVVDALVPTLRLRRSGERSERDRISSHSLPVVEHAATTPMQNAHVLSPRSAPAVQIVPHGEEPAEPLAATHRAAPPAVSLSPRQAVSEPPTSRRSDRGRKEEPETTQGDDLPFALPTPKRSKRALAILLLALALFGSLTTIVLLARRKPIVIERPVARPTIAVEGPVAEAVREGNARFRDGASDRARESFHKALSVDPDAPDAHLALAMLELDRGDHADGDRDEAEAITHFEKAFEARDVLPAGTKSADGIALVEALEPRLRPHPDFIEWEARLLRLSIKYSSDPRLFYWLGEARRADFDDAGAKIAFDRALALDPRFLPALAGRARASLALGESTLANEDLTRCLQASPIATDCVAVRYEMARDAGECARARDEANRWVGARPNDAESNLALAEALVATGAARDALGPVLARAYPPASAANSAGDTPADSRDQDLDVSLALLDGRGDDALKAATARAEAIPNNADISVHAAATLRAARIALDSGKTTEATDLAEGFLRRAPGLVRRDAAADPTIVFDAILLRVGRIDRAAFDDRRDRWLVAQSQAGSAAARGRSGDATKGAPLQASTAGGAEASSRALRWMLAYAEPAVTPADARNTLAILPEYLPLPPVTRRSARFDLAVGRVHLLAGKAREAIPYLDHAATSCDTLADPLRHFEAQLAYGKALEASGDAVDAKAAYEKLLSSAARPTGAAAATSAVFTEAANRLRRVAASTGNR
jgi:serine/threonine-protein kinase